MYGRCDSIVIVLVHICKIIFIYYDIAISVVHVLFIVAG